MKKYISLALLLLLVIMLCACDLPVTSSPPANTEPNGTPPPQVSETPKELSEKEINEMIIGTERKTAFEVMEMLKETGFTIVCYNDGHELSDFDPKAFYLKKDASLSYKRKEITFVLLPVDMYQYSGYEEQLGKVGDIIEFGTYEQDGNNSNGKESIKWVVLETEGSRYLLCSLYILDNQRYDGTSSTAPSTTWESCSLRSWLNDTFINEAFTQEQKSAIVLTSVENQEKDALYKSSGVNTTQDKVFLLSYDEAQSYFENESLRRAAGTHYAKSNKLFISNKTGMSSWWLRTPESATYKFVINPSGVHENSPRVNESEGVRPVLWVDMDLLK